MQFADAGYWREAESLFKASAEVVGTAQWSPSELARAAEGSIYAGLSVASGKFAANIGTSW